MRHSRRQSSAVASPSCDAVRDQWNGHSPAKALPNFAGPLPNFGGAPTPFLLTSLFCLLARTMGVIQISSERSPAAAAILQGQIRLRISTRSAYLPTRTRVNIGAMVRWLTLKPIVQIDIKSGRCLSTTKCMRGRTLVDVYCSKFSIYAKRKGVPGEHESTHFSDCRDRSGRAGPNPGSGSGAGARS